MRKHWQWKRLAACSVLVPVLLWSALPMTAGADTAAVISAAASLTPYAITSELKAGVKSVLNERTQEGTRIGVVVRLFNQSASVVVVPDYQVRVSTKEGISYALQPSAANAIAVQPRETIELSYMITVKRHDAFSLEKLVWLSVDEFVYPKTETVVASVGISSMEWRGDATTFSDTSKTLAWGEPFALSGTGEFGAAADSLRYTPVQLLDRETPQGAVTLARLLVENPGSAKQWIPDFVLVGKADNRYYTGTRKEAGTLSLEPGETRYIHYALPADHRKPWGGLTVATPESFVRSDGTVVPYTIGRLQIQTPASATAASLRVQPYKLKNKIALDASNPLANPDIELAVVELQRFVQDGDGYQTAVAKIQMTNRGSRAVLMPHFGLEWEASNGDRYEGVRQTTVWRSLLPGIGMVLNYAFTIPASEQAEKVVLHVLGGTVDGQASELSQVPIAAVSASLTPPPEASVIDMYPFAMSVDRWKIRSEIRGSTNFTYTYALEWDVGLSRAADAAVDKTSTRMRAELVDGSGRVLDSQTLPLSGQGRIVDGEQTIRFEGAETEQRMTSLAVNLYEVFDTAEGEVARLAKTLK
ncbi:hypothetical protein FE782_25025 [Paenibacillus antri]|uniref:DUF4139 domain-containing protein n=1 Tax=Paenibacillus antri TaxID=2582848 RepID=A0A5R9G8I9_9BACL|nr:hypothetical protein [Paenibacillus antri]TLS49384.1 hypothetical protein FE782_25025 [Paenibacillus antri]